MTPIRELRLDSWQQRLREISDDHRSPSSALASKATELLGDVAANEPGMLADVARGIVLAQPSMAALANVANVALRAQQTLGAQSVATALGALQRGVDADRRAAALALRDRLTAPVRVVTVSASAAVVEAVQVLHRAELVSGIVCCESRPLLEGTALARWFVEQGHAVTLTADAGLCDALVAGAIFVAGTDAILPSAVVNKRGTRVYATWARLAGVPAYVLASRDKIYPPALVSRFANPMRPAEELVQKPPPGLEVDNLAFDFTARSVWTEILVGGESVQEAEKGGDELLAEGLRPLAEAQEPA